MSILINGTSPEGLLNVTTPAEDGSLNTTIPEGPLPNATNPFGNIIMGDPDDATIITTSQMNNDTSVWDPSPSAPKGYQMVTFAWVLFAITTFLVIARVYAHIKHVYRPYREIYIVLSWVLYLGTTIVLSLLNHWDMYRGDGVWSQEQITKIARASYAQSFMWLPSLYCCKAVLLCLYGDLCPRHVFPRVWWSIVVSWVFVVLAVVYHMTMILFSCWPYSRNWEIRPFHTCPHFEELDFTSVVLHLFTDVLVYTIPFFFLPALRCLSWRSKAGAVGMFAAGLFNVVAAAMQVAFYTRRLTHPEILFWIPSGTAVDVIRGIQCWLYTGQQGTALAIVCMPAVRKLWHNWRAGRAGAVVVQGQLVEGYDRWPVPARSKKDVVMKDAEVG